MPVQTYDDLISMRCAVSTGDGNSGPAYPQHLRGNSVPVFSTEKRLASVRT